MAADDYSPADLAMGADLADAVNLAVAAADPADCLAVAWPAGDYDDDTDDCDCPEDCPEDSGHEWWCTR